MERVRRWGWGIGGGELGVERMRGWEIGGGEGLAGLGSWLVGFWSGRPLTLPSSRPHLLSIPFLPLYFLLSAFFALPTPP